MIFFHCESKFMIIKYIFFGRKGGGGGGGGGGGWRLGLVIFFTKNPNLKKNFFRGGGGEGDIG